MTLKSVISNHTASITDVLERACDVTKCGKLISTTYAGCVRITTYQLGPNIYYLTFVDDVLEAFELKDIYCFKLL